MWGVIGVRLPSEDLLDFVLVRGAIVAVPHIVAGSLLVVLGELGAVALVRRWLDVPTVGNGHTSLGEHY